MLEVGNGKLTHNQNVVHMSLWALLAAPLIAGNNLTQMTPDVTAILTNKEVVAIDQDSLGVQGDRVYAEGPIEIWVKALSDGRKAIGIFNFGETQSDVSLDLSILGMRGKEDVHDVWGNRQLGAISELQKVNVSAQSVLLLTTNVDK
jgi:alpha-galactosidase